MCGSSGKKPSLVSIAINHKRAQTCSNFVVMEIQFFAYCCLFFRGDLTAVHFPSFTMPLVLWRNIYQIKLISALDA